MPVTLESCLGLTSDAPGACPHGCMAAWLLVIFGFISLFFVWLQFFCCKYNDNSANITIFANKFSENRPIDLNVLMRKPSKAVDFKGNMKKLIMIFDIDDKV